MAGLTAALGLSHHNYDIAVFESSPYPHHKVCGEYLSQEVLPYMEFLGVDVRKVGARPIDRVEISGLKGKKVHSSLPLGGLGISRYALDHLFYQTALKRNITFYFEKVTAITFEKEVFTITSREREVIAPIVIGAYGKRSALDKNFVRPFISKKNNWLAVKSHYEYPDFPDDLVALHNFKGGYGGLSKTETGHVNFCYLGNYLDFKACRGILDFNEQVVSKNPHLSQFLKVAQPVFETPLSIGQISFEPKEPVVDHVLMCGDTAGLIHPLCGNGMAMAIHAGKLVSESVHGYFNTLEQDRIDMELAYKRAWNHHFKNRLRYGRYFQKILLQESLMHWGLATLGQSKHVLQYLIRKTHGKTVLP